MGPLMLDVQGCELDAEEREILRHPTVGGVILFGRNYHDRSQLSALVKTIRQAANKPLLIAVDHEGGRVQRFRNGFSRIPPMGILHKARNQATDLATECGWLMAAELLAHDIDLSFAPVLDLERGSNVIGDRSFSSDPEQVIQLASAFIDGMHQAGMKATGKHFPGHGSVRADSHLESPRDNRSWEEIEATDLVPFRELIPAGKLDAIMPAHVIYTELDDQPAGFSRFWLQEVLRGKYGFNGIIFSDDLTMEGAAVAGGYPERAQAALNAGCDMLLACNNRAGAVAILDGLQNPPASRAESLLSTNNGDWSRLTSTSRWKNTQNRVQIFTEEFVN
ncbi:glycoside hydrolase family 3 domain protein [Tolumonas auensis DSM 9187]|uniref:Beta-hexosaminidase n=2 Tax=Tolumonas TaxID=43947 RepID=NAGZ_TOLAT|nr:RecName: Full=Beta-hexosaminidase; AltName: Full=Beta-N-acetylhexosaminidase; AltName: Full=N-acetyl-beta-glucosaminidase [Tolumonas auensis DSM 9187]ACQ93153.1 glycoside hydrolase family 3 domain protein [Tolumonas auensis DSM 9187]